MKTIKDIVREMRSLTVYAYIAICNPPVKKARMVCPPLVTQWQKQTILSSNTQNPNLTMMNAHSKGENNGND